MSRLNPYWLWALLALPPAFWSYEALTSDNARIIHILVHPTGEWAARLLILTLMATPLVMLFKGWRGPQWLKKNRRYLGVAAFGYAALHTLFYVLDKGSVDTVLSEFTRFYIWTGWVAFAIFVPLAVTSMDYFMRLMGPRWKALQRWTYAAAVLTLLHWAALHNWGHPLGAIVHFAPLAALEAYRVWYWMNKRRMRRTVTATP
ncbi:sulfite oxidase heme-binding subunit YedZ [Tropicibacter sp. S64]|uniref:sulfite oxidase heme-binding subunit YedZ n=1 Tax=Tropicibacter sp. S64 TaxID=3415122 RepID=UPI003C7BEA7F